MDCSLYKLFKSVPRTVCFATLLNCVRVCAFECVCVIVLNVADTNVWMSIVYKFSDLADCHYLFAFLSQAFLKCLSTCLSTQLFLHNFFTLLTIDHLITCILFILFAGRCRGKWVRIDRKISRRSLNIYLRILLQPNQLFNVVIISLCLCLLFSDFSAISRRPFLFLSFLVFVWVFLFPFLYCLFIHWSLILLFS